MKKTMFTAFVLALVCAAGAVYAKTESAIGRGSSEPEACNNAKLMAKLALLTSYEIRYSSCNCQKKSENSWVCEVEARTVEK